MKSRLIPSIALMVACATAAPVFCFADEAGGRLNDRDCIEVGIYSVRDAMPGQEVSVPVTVSNTTGWGILAFDIQMCWCETPAGLLQFRRCEPGIVFQESRWTHLLCNPCSQNCVSIAAADPFPLKGSGPLFYLVFHVSENAKPCMCCDIMLEHAYLYDPEDPLEVCLTDGRVCLDYCEVRGVIRSWYCEWDECEGWVRRHGLEGVRVHLSDCNGPLSTEYTDPRGLFVVPCLEPLRNDEGPAGSGDCPYCVDLHYCAIPEKAITAYDASLVLQYLVCMTELGGCAFQVDGAVVLPQQVAADVNCTGKVTAYDAALILQYLVNMIPAFPCAEVWYWYAVGTGCCAHTCPGVFEFVGILKGDVSGPKECGQDLLASPAATIELGVPREDGEYIEVPVILNGALDVLSAQFQVEFDRRYHEFGTALPGPLADGFMTMSHARSGVAAVAMADSRGFAGSGRLAVLRFREKCTPVPGMMACPQLVSAMLNDGSPAVVIRGRDPRGDFTDFRLAPPSPNPFTHSTVLRFDAPADSYVSIEIYNVNGQLVKTVFQGEAAEDSHRVLWDGTDGDGSRVARGVYFCRMSSGSFSAAGKVVLLQ